MKKMFVTIPDGKIKNSNVRKWHTEVSRLFYKLNNSKIKGFRHLTKAYIELSKGD